MEKTNQSQEIIKKLQELKSIKEQKITQNTQALKEIEKSIIEVGEDVKNEIRAMGKEARAGVRLLKNANPYCAYAYQEVLRNKDDEIIEYGDVIIAGGYDAEVTGGDNAGSGAYTHYHRVNLPDGVFLLDVYAGSYMYWGIGGEKVGNSFVNASYLYVWGKNFKGALGVGHTNSVKIPQKVEFRSRIKKVAISHYGDVACAFVLLENGQLFGAGYNAQGQMGIGNNADCNRFVSITLPAKVKNIWCSRESDGLKAPSVFAQLEDNRLYAWGYNNFGQLGIGNNSNTSIPTLVGNLPQEEIIDLKTIADDAKSHTLLFMRGSGDYSNGFFGCGNDDEWQIGGIGSRNTFAKLSHIGMQTISSILFATNRHNVQGVMTKNNIYSWGFGENGFGDSTTGNRKRAVMGLPSDIISATSRDIICEPYRYAFYAILAIDSSKRSSIYTWGNNAYGKLGQGNNTPNRVLTKINAPKNIKEIAFSGCRNDANTMLLASDGYRIYGCGHAANKSLNFDTQTLTPQNIPSQTFSKETK